MALSHGGWSANGAQQDDDDDGFDNNHDFDHDHDDHYSDVDHYDHDDDNDKRVMTLSHGGWAANGAQQGTTNDNPVYPPICHR